LDSTPDKGGWASAGSKKPAGSARLVEAQQGGVDLFQQQLRALELGMQGGSGNPDLVLAAFLQLASTRRPALPEQ
jgi:hypothetical protein